VKGKRRIKKGEGKRREERMLPFLCIFINKKASYQRAIGKSQ